RRLLLLDGLNRSSQHGAQASEKFPRGEGLGQVIIGSYFESGDSVGFVAERAQHKNRNGGLFADLAQHIESVHSRQHHVENYRGIASLQGQLQAVFAVMDKFDDITQRLEIIAQQTGELRIIVDDQEPGRVWIALVERRIHSDLLPVLNN